MAYSLARVGEQVVYATDNLPMFDADFAEYEASYPISKVVDKTFAFPDLGPLDWVIVIPTGGISDVVYSAAARVASASGARLSLMSFESPNWFNSLARDKRSGLPWEAWRKSVAQGGLVLTIAREGIEPAKAFYKSPHHRATLEFAFWHPPLNDLAADAVPAADGPRDRVVTFVRTQDPHKGAADLLRLDPTVLSGKLLSAVFGRSVDEPYLAALKRHFSHAGVAIEAHDRISDREKFKLLSQAQLLLFPSYFEGFGYPVVEAAYMGVPSVSYDLPVVRETVGDAALYAPPGDVAAFSRAVRDALAIKPGSAVKAKLRIDPDTLSAGLKLQRLLQAHMKPVVPFKSAPSPVQVESPVRREVLADPAVDAQWRSALSGHRFRDVAGVVGGGRLTVTGKVETSAVDAQVRLVFGGARLSASQTIKSSKAELRSFEISAPVGPLDPSNMKLTVELFEQGKPVGAHAATLTVAPETLFRADAWSGSPVRQPYGSDGERALILADLDRLLACDLETLALSELAARFRIRGVPTTLLIEASRAPAPASLDRIDLDLAPLADVVEIAPRGSGEAALRSCAEGSGAMTFVAPADLATAMASEADLVVTIADKAPAILLKRFPAASKSKPRTIGYEPSLLSSRATVRSATQRVAIIGGSPSAEISAGLGRLFGSILPAAAAETTVAAVVMHRELLSRTDDRGLVDRFLDTVVWTATSGDFSALAAEARNAGQTIIIDVGIGQPDGRLAALAAATGATVLRLSDCDDAAAASAVVDALNSFALDERSALGAALAERWRESPSSDLIRKHSIARALAGANEATSLGRVTAPTMGVGRTFALSSHSDPEAGYLISGWGPRYVDGATVAAGGALIAFNLDRVPAGTVKLELLFRSKAPKNVTLKCAIALNGQTLGSVSLDRPIAKLFSFAVNAPMWRPGVLQTLTFMPEPVTVDNVQHAPMLIGLALMTQPPTPDWSTFDRDKPIIELMRLEEAAAYPLRFDLRSPESGDHSALGRGWGNPEAGHVWSVEPAASLIAGGAPTDGLPALVTIEAGALIVMGHASQHMRIETNGASLGERGTSQSFGGRFAFAASPAIAADGLDGFVMHFSDCVRPKDLGIGADARRLALSLNTFSIEIPVGPAIQCSLRPPSGGARQVSTAIDGFRASSAIVKLSGPGPAGSTIVFGAGLDETRVRAVAGAPGRWEAWLGVCDLSFLGLMFRSEPDSGTIGTASLDAIEVWPVGPEASSSFDLPIEYRMSIPLSALLSQPAASLAFGSDEDAAVLTGGWSIPEGTFRWSSEPRSVIDLSLAKAVGDFTLLGLEVAPFVTEATPRQSVRIFQDDREFAAFDLMRAGETILEAVLPTRESGVGMVELDFPDAASPESIGLSADTRILGLRIFGLTIDTVAADQPSRVVVDAAHPGGWAVSRSASAQSGVIVELVGPASDAPTYLGVEGEGRFTKVRVAEGRAVALLLTPSSMLHDETPVSIVAGVASDSGAIVEDGVVTGLRSRVRENV